MMLENRPTKIEAKTVDNEIQKNIDPQMTDGVGRSLDWQNNLQSN